ncbi:hypothetical protein DFH09DRAFT_1069642 [Mycena vulgaris]|nr:hypothetical protein DFH09DRAFT_1069642 [Mycena vulgaris]
MWLRTHTVSVSREWQRTGSYALAGAISHVCPCWIPRFRGVGRDSRSHRPSLRRALWRSPNVQLVADFPFERFRVHEILRRKAGKARTQPYKYRRREFTSRGACAAARVIQKDGSSLRNAARAAVSQGQCAVPEGAPTRATAADDERRMLRLPTRQLDALLAPLAVLHLFCHLLLCWGGAYASQTTPDAVAPLGILYIGLQTGLIAVRAAAAPLDEGSAAEIAALIVLHITKVPEYLAMCVLLLLGCALSALVLAVASIVRRRFIARLHLGEIVANSGRYRDGCGAPPLRALTSLKVSRAVSTGNSSAIVVPDA